MKFLNDDRLLAEVEFEPIQGSRFQPTGFPSLGPAEFTTPSEDGAGTNSLLVESAQSMANRLELVCIDDTKSNLVETLTGLPIIIVNGKDGDFLTSSIHEAHRMNSSYIMDKNGTFMNKLKDELNISDKKHVVNIPKFAEFAFKYDPNSLLHGVFVANSDIAGGRYKITRSISSFIEATNIKPIQSGGVKLDRVDPKGGDGGAEKGYGHILYSRTEYAAGSIKGYFNIDLALIRSYKLPTVANELLFIFALWKIQCFLNTGLRLRTACDLKVKNPLKVTRPDNFSIPAMDELDKDLRMCIKKCKSEGLFAESPVIVEYKNKN